MTGTCSGCGSRRREGAKFWLQVLNDLKQRGVQDILIACVDGLKGFPDAIEAVFPQTWVQTCIVHLIRHSLRYVPRREREQVARDLRPIYTAADADAALQALEQFDDRWGERFPPITKSWREAWEQVIPFLAFPPEVRRVIYTTNAIEALNRQLRKAIKTKGHFPNEEAARKLIYLAISNAVPPGRRPATVSRCFRRCAEAPLSVGRSVPSEVARVEVVAVADAIAVVVARTRMRTEHAAVE